MDIPVDEEVDLLEYKLGDGKGVATGKAILTRLKTIVSDTGS